MTKQTINVGTAANDKKGDSLRAAFQKVNANFTELYTELGLANDVTLSLGAFEFAGSTMSTTDSTPIVIDQSVTVSSDLTIGGDLLPNIANGGNLGSLAKPFRSLYVSNSTVFLGGVPLSLEAGTNELRVNNVPISQNITYTDIPNAPRDVSDLTDTGNLLGGGNTGTIWTNDANGCLRAELSATGFEAFTDATHLDLQDSGQWTIGSYQYSTIIGNDEFTNTNILSLRSGDDTYITTNLRENGNHQWKFGTDGTLSFPDSTVQTTAWTGDQTVSTTSSVKFNTVRSNILAPLTTGATRYTIANIAPESPYTNPVITITGTIGPEWVNGSQLEIKGVTTPTQANGTWYVQYRSANSFRLFNDAGLTSSPNASSWAAYTGSGIVKLSDSPANLTVVNNSNTWRFGTDGTLTLPNGSTIGDGDAVSGVPITTTRGSILIGNQAECLGGENHFHIMKAGQQDIDLFLGDDNNYVKLPSTGGVEISSSEIGAQHYWTFGADGKLNLPEGGDILDSNGDSVLGGGSSTVVRQATPPTASNGTLWFNTVEGRLYIKYNDAWVDAAPLMTPAPDTDIDVASITFPDASVQTTAFTGTALVDRLVNGSHEVVLNSNGDLLSANDIIAVPTGRFIKDCGNSGGTTSMRWTRVPTEQEVELIRIYTGDEENPDDVERAKISLEWQTPDQSGLSITAFDDGDEYKWDFKGDGAIQFPTLTVPISDNANPSGTGQTLKFSNSYQQAIIYGPSSTADNISAERVIIQGAPGYTGTSGEGGDVYLWAGPGGSTNGNGGDIKVRAGQANGTGEGGYLNFQAGDSSTGTGGYVNIESGSSNTSGQGGDITLDARSGGEIILRTDNGSTNKNWIFNKDGVLTTPGRINFGTTNNIGYEAFTNNNLIPHLGSKRKLRGLLKQEYANNNFTNLISTSIVDGIFSINEPNNTTTKSVRYTGYIKNPGLASQDFSFIIENPTPGDDDVTITINTLAWPTDSGGVVVGPYSYSQTNTWEDIPVDGVIGPVTQNWDYPNSDLLIEMVKVTIELKNIPAIGQFNITWSSESGASGDDFSGLAFTDVPDESIASDADIRILSAANTWTFGTDGSLSLPGAVVNSTVAKTGGGVGTETAIDLTKTVNKLTDGNYTLADGVEGQTMYLVRQTGAAYNAVRVNVANARIDGGLETTIDYYPFATSLNMSTLIFTDGAWQASVGGWD